MGTRDKVAKVGEKGMMFAGGFKVEVEIVDYKNSYGRDRWLVKPIAGSGEVWTEQDVTSN
jgi:hypothetical protein